jgi:hypothetical protein
MKLVKNEGILDRLLRIVLSEIFFLLAFFWLGGVWQILFYVLTIIVLITAITGFCGIYKIFNISTNKNTPSKKKTIISITTFVIVFIIIFIAGSYFSNFFTKKFFLEDYNKMNQYYKQTLFYTGQGLRSESLDNYNKLVLEYAIFSSKYQGYHPYVISGDKQFNSDLVMVSVIISELKENVNTGDLKLAHTAFEQVRPIFQDVLKRNSFSMLAVSLVDFHDAMEKIIAKADTKDSAGVIEVYTEVSDKLKAVEEVANDNEIQAIRTKLEEVLSLAKDGKANELSAKAAELKSVFVKVYLVRG